MPRFLLILNAFVLNDIDTWKLNDKLKFESMEKLHLIYELWMKTFYTEKFC